MNFERVFYCAMSVIFYVWLVAFLLAWYCGFRWTALDSGMLAAFAFFALLNRPRH